MFLEISWRLGVSADGEGQLGSVFFVFRAETNVCSARRGNMKMHMV